MLRWLVLGVILGLWPDAGWAHPGELDACRGHTAETHVEYPAHPHFQPTFASEPGEYHVHLTPAEIAQAQASLRAYQISHPAQTPLGPDYGSFTVGTTWYDILEYTKPDANGDRVAIVGCADGAEHSIGIVRVRQSPDVQP